MVQTTQEELELLCARFFPVFQEYVRRKSVATGDIELATSLDGIYSLPSVYSLGGVQKTVRVPVSLLTGKADEAATEATAAAKKAETAANMADSSRQALEAAGERIGIQETGRQEAEALRENAERQRQTDTQAAILRTDNAAASADTARKRIESEELGWQTAEQTREANEEIRKAQESKRQADTKSAISNAETATADAQDTADHPTYIGTDNYVYEWDKTTKSYNKTDKLVKSPAFSIDVQYTSISELEDDTRAYNDGLFAMVNTGDVENPDNARLYIRRNGAWIFTVDMSGAIGFTGKTPQLSIGTVTLGGNINAGDVSLTEDGKDADGNPKYHLNYVIPRLVYDDLTPDQIADLQRPASEMITRLLATDNAVKADEKLRIDNETARQNNEEVRKANEEIRKAQENKRQEDTTIAIENSESATAKALTEAGRAKGYADHPIIIGENSNWWAWDEAKQDYADTGRSAKGGVIYPSFRLDPEDMGLYMNDGASGASFLIDEDGCLVYRINN